MSAPHFPADAHLPVHQTSKAARRCGTKLPLRCGLATERHNARRYATRSPREAERRFASSATRSASRSPMRIRRVLAAIDAQRALTADENWGAAPIRVRMGRCIRAPRNPQRMKSSVDPRWRALPRVMAAAHGAQILVAASTPRARSKRETARGRVVARPGRPHAPRLLRAGTSLISSSCLDCAPEFPPIHTREALRTNLPPALSTFVGRERALADDPSPCARIADGHVDRIGRHRQRRACCSRLPRLCQDTFSDGVVACRACLARGSGANGADDRRCARRARGRRCRRRMALVEVDARRKAQPPVARQLRTCCRRSGADRAGAAPRVCPSFTFSPPAAKALGIEGEFVYRVPSLTLPAA